MYGREWTARSTPFPFSRLSLLALVIEFFILKFVDHEQEHEHDYDGRAEVTLSTLAYISR